MKAPAHGGEGITQEKPQKKHDIGIDALGADHLRVKTRGPDGGSDFRTKEPVDQGPDDTVAKSPTIKTDWA